MPPIIRSFVGLATRARQAAPRVRLVCIGGFACAPAAMLMPSLTPDALAADDSWTEVLRVSTGCIMNGDQPLRYSDGEPFTEGKNRGWPGDAGKAAYSFHPSAASHRGRWPYGCWFYLVKGAGVFVNVGRSLRAQTRACHVKKTEVGSGFGQLVVRRLVQHRIAPTAAHTRRPSSAIPPPALAGHTGPVFDPGAVTFTGSLASLARSARTPIARDRPETSFTATSRGNVASTPSKSRRRTSTSGQR